ncbi:leucine-rich repeat-containing protein 14 isoform X2 [Grus americana]|uniref:leucine-rich repeat-containing protein 14 isoform X2 n=1 Tax=Grus americana TaxID=9117 RepID=UPI0024084825|nr:leucine-rich repeat-containing protein 14 isoform X2 [Grus americana]
MHSLVFLCARRLVSHRPGARRAMDLLPAELYPVLFQAAFLDGRTLALRDLVGSWPFPVLSFRRLLAHRNRRSLFGEKSSKLCIQAVILAVVAHLRRALEESCRGTSESRCRLRVLDMTGLQDGDTDRGPEGMSLWSGTVALAKACIEVSKHQNECLKRGSKRRKGPSGVSAAPRPVGVEVRADLFVNGTSFSVLRDALQIAAAAGPLRLKCRDFHAEELSAAGTPEAALQQRRRAAAHRGDRRRHPAPRRAAGEAAVPQGAQLGFLQAFGETEAASRRPGDSPGKPGAGVLLPPSRRRHLPLPKPPRSGAEEVGPERPRFFRESSPTSSASPGGNRGLSPPPGPHGVPADGRPVGGSAAGALPLLSPPLPGTFWQSRFHAGTQDFVTENRRSPGFTSGGLSVPRGLLQPGADLAALRLQPPLRGRGG